MSIIRGGGWDSLKKMASSYREKLKRSLISISVCPHSESRMTREHEEGKTLISCTSCGKAYEVLKK
jgi:hypothetical protein